MRLPMRRRLGNESGGTLVETAISLSLLFLFMFGIIEGGLAIYSYHYLSHAARQGSRYALVRGSSWGTACTAYTDAGCTVTEAQIKQFVQNLGFPGINSNNISVTVQCATTTGTTVGAFGTYGNTCNASGDVVQVKVSYPFAVPIAGINGSCKSSPTSYCMSSTSEMVIAN